MSMITEQVKKLRELSKQDKLGLIPWNGYSEILNQAADTIEAYQKAFEDIRADLERIAVSEFIKDENGDVHGIQYKAWAAVKDDVLSLIDKHNPDKAGKERED